MTRWHRCRAAVCLSAAAILLASLFATGCGGPQGPPGTIWVTGSVLYDGKPLSEGAVHFAPKDQATASSGGSSRLKDSRFGLFLQPGNYGVAIISEEGVAVMDMKTGREIPAKSRIPEKYTAVTTSGLEATFDSGHRTADFSLAP
jgi:hypothetical protein